MKSLTNLALIFILSLGLTSPAVFASDPVSTDEDGDSLPDHGYDKERVEDAGNKKAVE